MADLFYLPFRPAYDGAGLSIPGAQAYFTLTGTNTPASIYSDDALTIPHTNPVVADGVGKFPKIYLDSGVSYRLRIYTRGSTAGISTPTEEYDPYLPGSLVLQDLDLGSVTGAPSVSSRSLLAAIPYAQIKNAILTESGRAGTFIFDSSNLSAMVSADTAQGIYVAPASAPTGASGAWVRQFNGTADARWWGAKGDNTTNDYAALVAAAATLKALHESVRVYSYGSSYPLQLPLGSCYIGANTLSFDWPIQIRGYGQGLPGGVGSQIRTDLTTALHFVYPNCSGWVVDSVTLRGGYTNGVESENHGIWAEQQGTVRNVQIYNFPGDALYYVGSVPTGNVNGMRVDNLWVNSVRNGIYLSGSDANGGTFTGLYLFSCRRAAIYDNSFLGNTFVGFVLEANGVLNNWTDGVIGPVTIVYNNGHLFVPVDGQEANASVNSPPSTATNNTYWLYWQDGPITIVRPQWFSGIKVRSGGAIIAAGTNESNFGPGYIEGDETSQIGPNNLILHTQGSGSNGVFAVSNGVIQGAKKPPIIQTTSGMIDIPGRLLVGDSTTLSASTHSWGPQTGTASDLQFNLYNTNVTSQINFYCSGVLKGSILNNFGTHYTQASSHFWRSIDGTVTYGQLGTSGLLMQVPIGYTAGAGGTVTQATSKTTGVTLNKPAGAITLNNAALAANTVVSFTLTNSTIGPDDELIVRVKSGAATVGTYRAWAEGNASGSRTINLQNISAGSLSEALVLGYVLIKGATS